MDFSIDRIPGFEVGRTSHLLQSEIRNGLNEAGLKVSAEGLSILLLLRETQKPIRVSELAKLAVRDGTTLKRQLDGLMQVGFVTHSKDESDRRAVLVSCTPEGKAAVEFIKPTLNAIREKALRGLAKRELAITVNVLQRVQANLLNP